MNRAAAIVVAVAGAMGAGAWWFGPDLAALIPRPPGWAWWVLAVAAVVAAAAARDTSRALLEVRDLLVARSEYTLATRMAPGPDRDSAVNASRQKLRRMGLTLEQIDKLEERWRSTMRDLTRRSF